MQKSLFPQHELPSISPLIYLLPSKETLQQWQNHRTTHGGIILNDCPFEKLHNRQAGNVYQSY